MIFKLTDKFSDLEVTLRTFDALIEEIAQKSEVQQKDTENFFPTHLFSMRQWMGMAVLPVWSIWF